MKRILVTLAVGLWAGMAAAAPPGGDVQAYAITPEAGPWVICAASYHGPDAMDMARLTVQYLRQRKLNAYIFDWGQERRRQQQEYAEEIRKHHVGADVHLRTVNIEEQCVVLVGGFKDMESASKSLPGIKKLPPPDMGSYKLERVMGEVAPGQLAFYQVNPFGSAFATPNPTVRFEKARGEKEYEVLKKLNEEEDFSLLKCKAPYTLAVQCYRGPSVIQTSGSTPNKLMKDLGLSKDAGRQLEAAAKQAHALAEGLRTAHYDAYVLHTRHCSYVTIGGFDSEKDAQLLRLKAHFDELAKHQNAGTGPRPVTMQFPEPQPMRVPQAQ